jgi:hypothetical protein
MSHTVIRRPLDLLRFVSIENEQFLVSLANNRDELKILSHIQGLYDAATAEKNVDENDMAVFQLLTFTHYHFLFSSACLMRCHLSEAFASARAAIDGALVAAQIIHDRASQVAYTKREKPFDNFARYLGNLIKDKKPSPHRLVPDLIGLHKSFSSFAAHADVGSFVHRVKFTGEPQGRMLTFEYFQFAQNETERKIHALTLFHTFVMILDVFSDFLVSEQKVVPKEWQDELRGLGGAIERHHDELKAGLQAEATPQPETAN